MFIIKVFARLPDGSFQRVVLARPMQDGRAGYEPIKLWTREDAQAWASRVLPTKVIIEETKD